MTWPRSSRRRRLTVPSYTLASPLTTSRSPLTRDAGAGSASAIGARGREVSRASGPATDRPSTWTATRCTVGDWGRVWTRARSRQGAGARPGLPLALPQAGAGREGPARPGSVRLALEQLADGGRGHRAGGGD